jgi:hypothetical protein
MTGGLGAAARALLGGSAAGLGGGCLVGGARAVFLGAPTVHHHAGAVLVAELPTPHADTYTDPDALPALTPV